MMAAHCSLDMAPVPESVSRSIKMSLEWDEKKIVAGGAQDFFAFGRAWSGGSARRI